MSIVDLFQPNNFTIYAENMIPTNNKLVPGTYTPAVSSLGNISALIVNYAKYVQTANLVTVYISATYTPTVVTDGSKFLMTIPIPRSISGNFVNVYDACGSGIQSDNNAVGPALVPGLTPVYVLANPTFQTIGVFCAPIGSAGGSVGIPDFSFQYAI